MFIFQGPSWMHPACGCICARLIRWLPPPPPPRRQCESGIYLAWTILNLDLTLLLPNQVLGRRWRHGGAYARAATAPPSSGRPKRSPPPQSPLTFMSRRSWVLSAAWREHFLVRTLLTPPDLLTNYQQVSKKFTIF